MKLEIEKIYNNNIVLNAIENGFKSSIDKISNEINNFDIQNLIEEVGYNVGWLDLSKYMNGAIKGHLIDIIRAYKNIGTYDSYDVLLKSFFGEDSVIAYDNYKAGCLSIVITTATQDKSIQTKDYRDIDLKNGKVLLAKNVIVGLSTSQLQVILQKIIPIGIYVTFTIN
jgi:hypothetical protein